MKINYLISTLLLMLLSMGVYAQKEKEPYVVIKGGTATFYYNANKPSEALPLQSIGDFQELVPWSEDVRLSVSKAVFDPSFKDFKPVSCACWFYGLENLTTILGMKEYLNTEKVTSMHSMFSGCEKLTSIDVMNFNTANVQDMGGMFAGCSSLISIDVSHFNTEKVTDMSGMFILCDNLTSIDVTNFKTANAQDMSEMFSGCCSLISIDVSHFNTEKVERMSHMFRCCCKLTSLDLSSFHTKKLWSISEMFLSCINLRTIYVSDGWNTDSVEEDYFDVFLNCENLVGGKKTSYSDYLSGAYDEFDELDLARIDGGKSSPGFFTKKK